jgi:predicted nucleic acid-binding protein
MKKIFIDANIYLNFFDSNKPELKKLLGSLLQIKDSLFIGSQIVNEVNRNKLDVAQRSLRNHFNNYQI